MTDTPGTNGSCTSPVERLRSLTDVEVTLTTFDGPITGSVLSCTRLSVWLISEDEDHVVPLDEITAVVVHERSAA